MSMSVKTDALFPPYKTEKFWIKERNTVEKINTLFAPQIIQRCHGREIQTPYATGGCVHVCVCVTSSEVQMWNCSVILRTTVNGQPYEMRYCLQDRNDRKNFVRFRRAQVNVIARDKFAVVRGHLFRAEVYAPPLSARLFKTMMDLSASSRTSG